MRKLISIYKRKTSYIIPLEIYDLIVPVSISISFLVPKWLLIIYLLIKEKIYQKQAQV
jgi:hypothetical protein